jgi:DNA-directed RNA polymerase specialized sigma24 family protein
VTSERSLLEAFRQCGPLIGEPTTDAARNTAAETLHRTLNALAAGIGFDASIREEAIQVVLFRLARSGPRGVRAGDPDSDAAVRGYLKNAVRNAARDLLPKRTMISLEASTTDPIDGGPNPDQALDLQEVQQLVEAAQDRFHRIVDHIAGSMGTGSANFRTTIAELEAIGDGAREFDDLVRQQMEATGDSRTTVRNRYYQRYARALRRLHEAAEELEPDLTPLERQCFRGVVDRLRLQAKP